MGHPYEMRLRLDWAHHPRNALSTRQTAYCYLKKISFLYLYFIFKFSTNTGRWDPWYVSGHMNSFNRIGSGVTRPFSIRLSSLSLYVPPESRRRCAVHGRPCWRTPPGFSGGPPAWRWGTSSRWSSVFGRTPQSAGQLSRCSLFHPKK